MASPQTENGFTRIANELLDVILSYRCSTLQKEIILAVIRYTYGFQRKEAQLSVRFLAKYLSRSYQKVSVAVKGLIEKNVIHIVREYNCNQQARILKLNKDYDSWNSLDSLPDGEQLPNSIENSPPEGEQNSPLDGEQRNKTPKKTLNKYSSQDFEKFWSIFPNSELGGKGSRKRAMSEFLKLSPGKVTLETLIAAVTKQAEYKLFMKSKGEFVPQFQHVERWIKNERWNDEIPEQQITELRSIE